MNEGKKLKVGLISVLVLFFYCYCGAQEKESTPETTLTPLVLIPGYYQFFISGEKLKGITIFALTVSSEIVAYLFMNWANTFAKEYENLRKEGVKVFDEKIRKANAAYRTAGIFAGIGLATYLYGFLEANIKSLPKKKTTQNLNSPSLKVGGNTLIISYNF
jgi:hypothetical protein